MLNAGVNDRSLDDPVRLAHLFAPVTRAKRLALAVSGGVDSLAMTALVSKWVATRDERPQITVFTVDHGLRQEAEQETGFVAHYARELGFAVRILRGDIVDPGSRLQEKARALRYGLISKAMAARGISVLMVAHTLNDQAETVLMRMARGSGITGLGGMAPRTNGDGFTLVRPLLDIPRVQIEAFVAALNVEPVRDPSNDDPAFERVRWRQSLPQFDKPGLSCEKVGMAAARLRRADDALAAIARHRYTELFTADEFGCVGFDVDQLLAEPAEIAIRLLFRAIDGAGGNHAPPALRQIERFHDHLSTRNSDIGNRTLGGCAIQFRERKGLIFRECGRLQRNRVKIFGEGEQTWDKRFRITLAGRRYESVHVSPAIGMSRKMLRHLIPGQPFAPIGAVRSSPIVTSGNDILALGEHALTGDVNVCRIFGPDAMM